MLKTEVNHATPANYLTPHPTLHPQLKSIEVEEVLCQLKGIVHHLVARLISYLPRYDYEMRKELEQEGYLALCKAIRMYDGKHNAKLSTYAYTYIYGHLLNFIRDRKRYSSKTLNFSDIDGPQSRNSEDEDEKLTFEQTLTIEDNPLGSSLIYDPFRIAERTSAHDKIQSALTALTDQESQVIGLHFFQDHSLSEIADDLGVSKPRITKIMNNSLEKLRNQITYN